MNLHVLKHCLLYIVQYYEGALSPQVSLQLEQYFKVDEKVDKEVDKEDSS